MPGTGRTGDSISVRGVIYDFVDGKWEQQSNGANAGALQQEIRVEVREREAADEDFLTESQINGLIEAYGEPFTDALLSKLNGLEALRNAAQTYALIEASLNTAIADAIASFRTQAQINALIEAYGEPFTTALLSKLNGLEALRNAAQTYALIEASLNTAIADAIASFRTQAQINALIEAYGEPFTTALLNKLGGIEDEAKDDLTADEIVDLIEAQTGDGRLDATHIRNIQQAQFDATAAQLRATLVGVTELAEPGDGIDFVGQSNGKTQIRIDVTDILGIGLDESGNNLVVNPSEILSQLRAALLGVTELAEAGDGIDFVGQSNGKTQIRIDVTDILGIGLDESGNNLVVNPSEILSQLRAALLGVTELAEAGDGIDFVGQSNGKTQIRIDVTDILGIGLDESGNNLVVNPSEILSQLRAALLGVTELAEAGDGIDFVGQSNGKTQIRIDVTDILGIGLDESGNNLVVNPSEILSQLRAALLGVTELAEAGDGIDFVGQSNGKTQIRIDVTDILGIGLDESGNNLVVNPSEILSQLRAALLGVTELAEAGDGIDFVGQSNGKTQIRIDVTDILGIGLDESGNNLVVDPTEFLVAGTGISFTNLGGGRIRIDAT